MAYFNLLIRRCRSAGNLIVASVEAGRRVPGQTAGRRQPTPYGETTMPTTPTTRRDRVIHVTLWTVQVLLALLFLAMVIDHAV